MALTTCESCGRPLMPQAKSKVRRVSCRIVLLLLLLLKKWRGFSWGPRCRQLVRGLFRTRKPTTSTPLLLSQQSIGLGPLIGKYRPLAEKPWWVAVTHFPPLTLSFDRDLQPNWPTQARHDCQWLDRLPRFEHTEVLASRIGLLADVYSLCANVNRKVFWHHEG